MNDKSREVLLKRMIAEFHQVEKYLLGDFYPLTPHSPPVQAASFQIE